MTGPLVTPGIEYSESELAVISWYVREMDGRPIIVASNQNLKRGDKVDDKIKLLQAPWGATVYIKEPLVVVREVPFREWQDSLPEGSPGKRENEALAKLHGIHFYEVGTD